MSEINVSSFVFNKIKIEAKNLKKTHPSLTYMQLLDEASKAVAGKRHYHEANKLHESYLKSNAFSHELTLYQCPYCHYNFCPDLKESRIEHERNHRTWEKAEYYLGSLPRSFKQREKLKKIGYDRISEFDNKFSRNERLEGAQMLLEAYYDKSLSGALTGEYWKEHPKFEEYIALVNHEKVFPKDISNYLREKYGTNSSSQENYWFPA